LSGALNAEGEQIIRILGFREGELPMKYLGVPLLSSRLKVVYCKGLVDQILYIGLVEHSCMQDGYN